MEEIMLRTYKKVLIRTVVIALVAQASMLAAWLPFGIDKAKADEPVTPVSSVIINEVMWMGNVNHYVDEWIELKNTTSHAIDISKWQIINSGLGEMPVGKSIPANGFFLVANYDKYSTESTSTILNIQADLVDTHISIDDNCSTKGGLILEDSALNPIDTASCVNKKWPAGEDDSINRSMERDSDGIGWHSSVEQINLISGLGSTNNFATPGAQNSQFGSITLSNNDVFKYNNQNYTLKSNELSATWSLTDLPNKLEINYSNSIIPPTTTWTTINDTTATSGAVTGLTLNKGSTYYFFVRASFNTVDKLILVSAPIVHDNPFIPTSLKVTNSNNGNSTNANLSWQLSQDPAFVDGEYKVSYREYSEQGSNIWSDDINAPTLDKSYIITGLENNKQYEYRIKSVGRNGVESGYSTVVKDNLPEFNTDKITVNQNNPGTDDTISTLAGAVTGIPVINEDTYLYLYVPSSDGSAKYNTTLSINPDGSFSTNPIDIGDNIYGNVWLQIDDRKNTGKESQLIKFDNDIVAPNPPTIQKITAECVRPSCTVNVSWTDNGPDTREYKIGYILDGVEKDSFGLTTTSVALDLISGKNYQVIAYAIDGAGNVSGKSNIFNVSLVQGVNLVMELVNGEITTSTTPVEGTLVEVQAEPTNNTILAPFIPAANAAEPSPAQSPTPTPEPATEVNNGTDWTRLGIGALLLLVVAGSFYALSKSIGKDEEIISPPKTEQPKEGSPKKKPNNKKKR